MCGLQVKNESMIESIIHSLALYASTCKLPSLKARPLFCLFLAWTSLQVEGHGQLLFSMP